jgi:L-seryl-tRNA(Ser) seleniumtransferase
VDELLRRPALAALWGELGPAGSRRVIQAVLAEWRAARAQPDPGGLEQALRAAAERRRAPSLRPLINATGVILHTNLGRAPLAAAAVVRLAEAAADYTNLEYDLASGARARRDRHLEALLAELTGAEASLVVNNNAAAVMLVVNTLTRDRDDEILISRGELVEIGESFRIAEIVARGGARLVEVGATNRTRLDDYAAALTPRTRFILRVHRSNFVQRGYVGQPSLAELASLARTHGLPLVEDQGSGCLARMPGIAASEPIVRASLEQGADLVTYSGDKLLGGPQAGLLSGDAALAARLRANPMFRALRVDKLRLAALAATLALHARQAWDELPVAAMAAGAGLEARTRALAARLPAAAGAEVLPGASLLGGGSSPEEVLAGWLIALPEPLAPLLRGQEPPVVARVENHRCLLDLRTVPPAREEALLGAVAAATAAWSALK